MNEVTVLSAAGELTGRALGNGVRAVRRSTVALSRSGGAAGLAAARAAGRTAADVARIRGRAASARVASVTVPRASRRRPTWPWVLLALGVLGGGAVAAVLRRPIAPPPAPEPPRVADHRPPEEPDGQPSDGADGAELTAPAR